MRRELIQSGSRDCENPTPSAALKAKIKIGTPSVLLLLLGYCCTAALRSCKITGITPNPDSVQLNQGDAPVTAAIDRSKVPKIDRHLIKGAKDKGDPGNGQFASYAAIRDNINQDAPVHAKMMKMKKRYLEFFAFVTFLNPFPCPSSQVTNPCRIPHSTTITRMM